MAFSFNISVPIHTLFRSCNVIASVLLGCASPHRQGPSKQYHPIMLMVVYASRWRDCTKKMITQCIEVCALWSTLLCEAAGVCLLYHCLKLSGCSHSSSTCDCRRLTAIERCHLGRHFSRECCQEASRRLVVFMSQHVS